MMEKLFPRDVLTKRERVMRALYGFPTDRVPIHEQMSYNNKVISLLTGRHFNGYDYTLEDIGSAIRKSCDMCFPPVEPKGTDVFTDEEGFVYKNDNWTTWRVSRPMTDEHGAAEWLRKRISILEKTPFYEKIVAEEYAKYRAELQGVIGETVLCDYSCTGFCDVFDRCGLEIYTFLELEYPELLQEYYELSLERELLRVDAIADPLLIPVILIPEDFGTKQGPIFNPGFLEKYHYPYVKRLTSAWRERGTFVIYHSDGNYKKAIPALIGCGIQGFYCLEPACGMDTVELSKTWPDIAWLGGVDGVDLMERGTPAEVCEAVRHQIAGTNALYDGRLFIATSSEINPPIKTENFMAMVNAADEFRNELYEKLD